MKNCYVTQASFKYTLPRATLWAKFDVFLIPRHSRVLLKSRFTGVPEICECVHYYVFRRTFSDATTTDGRAIQHTPFTPGRVQFIHMPVCAEWDKVKESHIHMRLEISYCFENDIWASHNYYNITFPASCARMYRYALCIWTIFTVRNDKIMII